MWTGDGWKRTQRQLGVVGLVACFAAEIGLQTNVPVGLYTIIGGLLGLDVLAEALDRLKGSRR